MGTALLFKNGRALYMTGAIGVSLACAFATLFVAELSALPLPIRLLANLNLANENGIGAWWSGMLLLLASLQAAERWLEQRGAEPAAAKAWAALSVLLLVLSLDEVGSLHERVAVYLGGWSALAPFALALAALGVGAILGLWRSARQPALARQVAAAFALFGLVAVQEVLENRTQWWGVHTGVRPFLEEGTELAAMLILLRVTLANASAPWLPLGILEAARARLVAGGLVAALPLAWVSVHLPDAHRGNPAAWLAAAGSAAAAVAVAAQPLRSGLPLHWRRLLACGACAALSLCAVAFNPAQRPPGAGAVAGGAALALAAAQAAQIVASMLLLYASTRPAVPDARRVPAGTGRSLQEQRVKSKAGPAAGGLVHHESRGR